MYHLFLTTVSECGGIAHIRLFPSKCSGRVEREPLQHILELHDFHNRKRSCQRTFRTRYLFGTIPIVHISPLSSPDMSWSHSSLQEDRASFTVHIHSLTGLRYGGGIGEVLIPETFDSHPASYFVMTCAFRCVINARLSPNYKLSTV